MGLAYISVNEATSMQAIIIDEFSSLAFTLST